ncbi:MAG: BREX-2 system phosphatase PglZ [Polyangiaceae bacterium]|nr:BREX-2 system phosphatase PglZ [Polyangiaceae bacterium]
MTIALGDRVLDWMLRRLRQAVHLEHDLVLVHDGPALSDVASSIDVGGETWRVARVTGELTLRDALPEADRLVAIVPLAFPPLPMDIGGRTYLGRVLDVRAEDLIAAVSDRFCEALVDEGLVQGVFDSVDTLRITVGRWSLGELVTAREVRSVLVGAELGAARLDRERDWELLARWILDGAPTFRAPTLVRAALVEAHPRSGAWLAWALTDGTLAELCTAGALTGSVEGEGMAPDVPGVGPGERGPLGELVDSALREVWRRAPVRAREVLIEAERAARTVALDAERHRLLRVPLEGALSRYANAAAEGHPPDDIAVEGLKRNLHAPDLGPSIGFVADLARLARSLRLDAPSDASAAAWFGFALRDVAWADLAYRRVRRQPDVGPPWLGDPARRVIAAWLDRRDALNGRFAGVLAANWMAVAGNTDPRQPLALHQITRCLVWRLVDDGSRVLLLVLDGCDLASFLEILDSLPPERRLGLVLPEVRNAVLRDDLTEVGALAVAVAPLPTVTSHARRALFAGEIPGNSALDDTESAAANATADQTAWSQNRALGEIPRRLFLKGDLGTSGQVLLSALRDQHVRVLAAVFNGVDDALSSKETTAPPAWSLGALGAGAAEVVATAVDEGWCVLVTADHGHTPFVGAERKVAQGGLGQRLSTEASDGSVTFRDGPLPRRPLHLLTGFGTWFGAQRRGFHGGAAIEEVAVPLAFLGRVRGEQEGRAAAPSWWWSSETAPPIPPPSLPRVAPPTPHLAPPVSVPRGVAQPGVAPDPRLAPLSETERRVVSLVRENQSVRLSAIAQHIGKTPIRAAGFMQLLVRKLSDLRCPCLSVEMLPDGDRLYRYQEVDRGDR